MANYVNLLDIIYPIGSVYITFSSTNPADVVGGTWEKIDGKFLQSSSKDYSVNSTGGFSGNIGFSMLYGAWWGAMVPTYNATVDDSILSFGTNSSSNNFTGDITQYYSKVEQSTWDHKCNAGVSDTIKVVSKPAMYTKEIYWDTRPAYITCNMYKRVS